MYRLCSLTLGNSVCLFKQARTFEYAFKWRRALKQSTCKRFLKHNFQKTTLIHRETCSDTAANRLPTEVFIMSVRCQSCPSQNCASARKRTISIVLPGMSLCRLPRKHGRTFPLPAALVRDCVELNAQYGPLLEESPN